MARGIMADKEDKIASSTSEQPADSTAKIYRNSNTLNNNDHRSSGDGSTAKPVSSSTSTSTTCSCTKISTMQLFYEMKQKFPTVPDNVVCEFVGQNCHNRSACIDGLEDYPNSANVYPQALRNQPMKKKAQWTATVPTNHNESNPQPPQSQQSTINGPNTTDSEQMTNPTDVSNVQRKPAPPTTLNLTNLNCCTRPVNRPTRQAPPPPIVTPTIATTPTQSIKSLPNQPLNLSVNVIVSPVSRTPKSQQSQSHYSFTLHQPNNTHSSAAASADMQSAAETTAAAASATTKTTTTDAHHLDVPSLKYTSSAYDAEIGYQSRFEITVAGINSKSTNDNCDDPLNDNANDENSNNISLKRSCEITADNNNKQLPSVVASTEFLEESMLFVKYKMTF